MLCVSFLRMKNYSNTYFKNMNTFFHFFPVFSELLSKAGQTFFQIVLTISAISILVLVHVILLSACARAKLFQSCPALCDSTDCSTAGSSVHGILQARILEWVALPFSRGSSQPWIEPTSLTSPVLAGGFFTTSTTWEAPGTV